MQLAFAVSKEFGLKFRSALCLVDYFASDFSTLGGFWFSEVVVEQSCLIFISKIDGNSAWKADYLLLRAEEGRYVLKLNFNKIWDCVTPQTQKISK